MHILCSVCSLNALDNNNMMNSGKGETECIEDGHFLKSSSLSRRTCIQVADRFDRTIFEKLIVVSAICIGWVAVWAIAVWGKATVSIAWVSIVSSIVSISLWICFSITLVKSTVGIGSVVGWAGISIGVGSSSSAVTI